MCIICECGTSDASEEYLMSHEKTKLEMRKAAKAMLECSKVAITKEGRKSYDNTHKKMVKLIRDWNRIEQEREEFYREAHHPKSQ